MSIKAFMGNRTIKSLLMVLVPLGLMLAIRVCLAETPASAGGGDLGTMAASVTTSFAQFGQLMVATAYVAGIAFCIMAIFKFKQHRDNPTQIPMGTPIALLTIGIVLIFFPAIIKPAGSTLLGGADTTAGGFTGAGATKLPGGQGTT